MIRMQPAIRRFLNRRYNLLALAKARDAVLLEPVPARAGWGHTLGSLAILGLSLQMVSGVLLLIYYHPTVEQAHLSLEFITHRVHFGWLIRECHAWGAHLLVLGILGHMGHTFLRGAHKTPRELTWISGVLLFVVVMLFGYTGYLLPWNQRAYWGTIVGTDAVRTVPLVGELLLYMVRGGEKVGSETLNRFFALHVVVLPWVLLGLVVIHLVLMRSQGLTTAGPVGREERVDAAKSIPFFPIHAAREAALATLVFGILVTLAIVSPHEIGAPADPLDTPSHVKPEWYFLPIYQALKYLEGPYGKWLGLLAGSAPMVILLALPFIDRGHERNWRRRPVAMTLAAATLLTAITLGVLGQISGTRISVLGSAYDVDYKGVPHRIVDLNQPSTSAAQSRRR